TRYITPAIMRAGWDPDKNQVREEYTIAPGKIVVRGKLHPSFLPDSTSLKIRNGVGVAADGKVSFAISDGAVRFHDFATLFRDELKCDDALFLDGSISSLDIPEWRRRDSLFPLGPIIAVTQMLPG
ncbi:MAG: hypothetical protein E6Q76_11490, partial [Rhizobium sp.]